MKYKKITAEIQQMKATVWIGKRGITESTIDEIKSQVKDKRIVKVKWLRNIDVDPGAVAEMTGTDLIMARGRTMVLSKK